MPSSKPEVSMSKMRCDLLQLHIPPNSSEEHFNFQVGFTKAAPASTKNTGSCIRGPGKKILRQ